MMTQLRMVCGGAGARGDVVLWYCVVKLEPGTDTLKRLKNSRS